MRALGRSGIKVSALGLGTMGFGSDWHGVGSIDEKTARGMVDLAIEKGVNFFDTADIYGRGASERMLGKILAKRRARFVIATKVLGQMRPGDAASGGLSRKHILEGLDASLKRLKTDFVDLYMPHDTDPRVPLEESLEAFDRAKRAGKIRALGCSNFTGGDMRDWLSAAAAKGWARLEFNEIQFSLACRDIEGNEAPVCAASGLGLIAWSPLGGGFLSAKYGPGSKDQGRRSDPSKAFPPLPETRLGGLIELLKRVAVLEGVTPAQAALGWALGKPWLSSALLGARTLAQLEQNLAAKPLSARGLAFLEKGSAV